MGPLSRGALTALCPDSWASLLSPDMVMGEGGLAGHLVPAPWHLTLQTVGSLQACLRGAQLLPHPSLWLGDRSGGLFIPPHTPLTPGFTWNPPQPLASPLTYF